jgi:hypothetical protein
MRVRWNMNTDTPLPPDEPGSENPPDGAIIDYYLSASSAGPVTLEIRDAAGEVVRRYSSQDPIPAIDPMLGIPPYWLRPVKSLSRDRGMHRFLWDMHYAPIPGLKPEYPIAAVYRNTAPAFTSPWVMPGKYTVVLSVNEKTYTAPLLVQMDPRVKTPARDLAEQFKLAQQVYEQWLVFNAISNQIKTIKSQLTDLRSRAKIDELKTHIDALNAKLDALAGAEGGRPDPAGKLTIQSATAKLRTLFSNIQDVDVAPTPAVVIAAQELSKDSQLLATQWQAIRSQDVPSLNQELRAAGLAPVNLEGQK